MIWAHSNLYVYLQKKIKIFLAQDQYSSSLCYIDATRVKRENTNKMQQLDIYYQILFARSQEPEDATRFVTSRSLL